MKAIIAGGGTGGHLFPGLAVADELKQNGFEKVLFVGSKHGIEARLVPKSGYEIRFVSAKGFVGKSFKDKVSSMACFAKSIFESLSIIKSFNPDVIIGVGGYASVGCLCAGRLSGIATLIMEQNSYPGTANRFLSNFVDAIAVTYQDSIKFFPNDITYLTGNPIRKDILQQDRQRAIERFEVADDKFTILVFGGSRGARAINQGIIDSLPHILDLRDRVQFVHQTGEEFLTEVTNAYKRYNFLAVTRAFITDMADAYALADMVICRAGATTLAEITALGKPALLIPYPYATADHQRINAQKLQAHGAGRMLCEPLNGSILAGEIRHFFTNPEMLKEMSTLAKSLGRIDASQKIVELVISLVKNKAKK